MSLVDYASSSEEEKEGEDEEQRGGSSVVIPNEQPSNFPNQDILPHPTLPRNQPGLQSNQQVESCSDQPEPSRLILPDASLLLNSPAVSSDLRISDHSSRVAAAMAENASRKRDLNGSASMNRRSKVPKGNLPHSRGLPDTAGGLLRPPQLGGRSNVVTEDISKLFVRRPADPSSS